MQRRILFFGVLAAMLGCSPASFHMASDASTVGGSQGESVGGNASGSGGASQSGAGSGGTAGGVPAKHPMCGSKTFGLTNIPPDLLVVEDKSGSMDQGPDGAACPRAMMGCSKWTQITTAINQVVMQTQASIRWGLKFFPDDNHCLVNDGAMVPIADNNAAMIAAGFAAQMPNGKTPTRVAVTSAGAYLTTLADPNPKYILLATDGLPNCGEAQDDDAMGAIQAVKDVAAMGVPVFVVGIGTVADAQATLTAMAIAGGVPQAAAPRYYPVASTAQLVTVLGTIGRMIGFCSFGLGSKPPDPNKIMVTADGATIPKDPTHANGWDYGTGGTSIQLYGKTCEDAKAGKLKDINATFGCPDIVVK